MPSCKASSFVFFCLLLYFFFVSDDIVGGILFDKDFLYVRMSLTRHVMLPAWCVADSCSPGVIRHHHKHFLDLLFQSTCV